MAPTLTGEEVKSEKKKLKSASASSVAKPKQDSIYQDILAMELKESEERPADKDAVLFSQTCNELRAQMKDILDMKVKQGQAKASGEIQEKRIQASLLFVTLKKLNRLEKLRIKRCRDRTSAANQSVDAFNLQLQNLLYEVLHLKKEVTKCINYKSADEAMDLVPVNQFYEEAPGTTSRPEVTRDDPHLQRLARLEWELATRKQLDEECQELESRKTRLAEEIREKESKLSQLAPQLGTILEATKPVQDYLSLPLDKERSQHSLARLLPDTLYILYTQASAYSQACDDLLEVVVEGDEEEARHLREEGGRSQADEEEEEENDKEEEDEEGQKKKKRRGPTKDKVSDKKKQVLKKHPLQVKMEVMTKDGDSVSCTFNYLLMLGIVTVETKLNLTDEKLSGEALQADNILSHLYQGDDGQESPNPSNQFQLRKAGLSEGFTRYVATIGLPYVWAQRLAGMDFLSVVRPKLAAPSTSEAGRDEGEEEDGEEDEVVVKVAADTGVAHMQMENTVKGIRARLMARLALQKQLNNLEKSKASSVDLLPTKLTAQFPTRVTSRLRNWTTIDWEAYSVSEVTRHLVRHEVVDQHDFFYKAQCNREQVSLIALVAIKPNYPVAAPIFCLNLHWNGEHNVHNSEWIRDLEREVNLGWTDQISADLAGGDLLAIQLHRLLVLLDVMLEAGSQVTGSNDFPKEKVFFSAVRGRMRSLPLLFSSKMQIFQQR